MQQMLETNNILKMFYGVTLVNMQLEEPRGVPRTLFEVACNEDIRDNHP